MKNFLIIGALLLSFTAFATAFTENRNDKRCCCEECHCKECVCEENCEECRDCQGYYCEECEEHHEFRHREGCCRDYHRHEYRLDRQHRHSGCCHQEHRRHGCCD